MNEFILIAHGAWSQTDGQTGNGREALYSLPNNLTIKTYNLQNTCISKSNGFMILNNLLRNNGNLGFVHGENLLNGIRIIYKEYSAGTQSSMISDYNIGGDDSCATGIYQTGVNDIISRLNGSFHSYLSDIIRDNGITNVLHLICCQEFE